MNLDELMSVWRSQDAAPLHGLNETQLRLALRQNEAKRQDSRGQFPHIHTTRGFPRRP